MSTLMWNHGENLEVSIYILISKTKAKHFMVYASDGREELYLKSTFWIMEQYESDLNTRSYNLCVQCSLCTFIF